MKASELITQLQGLVEKYGDQQVLIQEDGMGGYAMHSIWCGDDIDITPYDLCENEDPDSDMLKELFPTIDLGDKYFDEWLDKYEGEDKCLYFTIGSGSLIYST